MLDFLQSLIDGIASVSAWMTTAVAGAFAAFSSWLEVALTQMTGAPVSPEMAELAAIGISFSGLVVVFAFLMLSGRKRRKSEYAKRAKLPPVSGEGEEPESKQAMLADIEMRMFAIKTGYKNGAIAKDIYLARSRALYERARQVMDGD